MFHDAKNRVVLGVTTVLSLDVVETLHGHDGRSKIRFIDELPVKIPLCFGMYEGQRKCVKCKFRQPCVESSERDP